MIDWILAGIFLLVLGWAVFATWQMVKFAKIIFLVEDRLEDGLDSLTKLDETLTQYLSMRLFWDSSPDVKAVLDAAKADTIVARARVLQLADALTKFSKQKYVIDQTEDVEDVASLSKTEDLIRKYPEYTEPVPQEEIFRDEQVSSARRRR